MLNDKKDIMIYELRFDKYIRLIIRGTFFTFEENSMSQFDSLNEPLEGGNERIDFIMGEHDVRPFYELTISNPEYSMDTDLMYEVLNLLSKKEKVVVSLRFLEGYEIEDLSHYFKKTDSATYKLVERVRNKIKKNIKDGGYNHD